MPNYRPDIRTSRAVASSLARQAGVNVDDVRRESRSDSSMDAMISRLANDSTPTQGHERQAKDDFVGQTFDGTNTDFTLSRRVLGYNIELWRIEQATGTPIPLIRTTNPAPSGIQFWFDGYFTVRVGTPPAVLDGLIAAYVTLL